MSWDLSEAIAYYRRQGAPGDQNAVVQLLRELQHNSGGSIPAYALEQILREYGMKESFLKAIIKRYPGLRMGEQHCLELCAGPNCGKHARLAAAAEKLQKIHPEKLSLRYVPCMRLCGKGPNIKWDGKLYHGATEELLRSLAEQL